jgi:hypothetical protein
MSPPSKAREPPDDAVAILAKSDPLLSSSITLFARVLDFSISTSVGSGGNSIKYVPSYIQLVDRLAHRSV